MILIIYEVWYYWVSQVALVAKNRPANVRDMRLIPGSGRSPGGGHRTHSNILAWRIPWTEEPGRLQSMGSQRVGHNWSNLACTHDILKMILIIINLLIKYVSSKPTKTEIQPSHYSQKKNNAFSDSFQKFLHLHYLKALYFVEGSLGKINRKLIFFFFLKAAVLGIDC